MATATPRPLPAILLFLVTAGMTPACDRPERPPPPEGATTVKPATTVEPATPETGTDQLERVSLRVLGMT